MGEFSTALYSGYLDEVRIYDRELTPAEIADNYNAMINPSSPYAGDLDGDWYVGDLDRQIIIDNWALSVTSGDPLADPRADPSGDGIVNGIDLDIVENDWGMGTPPELASSIPEPGSLTLLALGSLVLLVMRHRCRV